MHVYIFYQIKLLLAQRIAHKSKNNINERSTTSIQLIKERDNDNHQITRQRINKMQIVIET